ncbi:hypothetical protein [Marinobacter sp. ELB17]|uniref:hypothetical protein n=1 Tax=Marinobacter sp. ELB17 TaxID=270374 RepID=UPI0000F37FC1|nr:hypothetical protein [Marinobacter sp. ELB17]EBA00098.1 transposase [Marinobacter sp. ELB17]
MQHRQNGASQEVAAAKAGVSVRSGRRIETSAQKPCLDTERQWRTREDPLEAVWETELLHLLENEPKLTGTTLLDYLQEHYPEHYDQTILRTLQRRVKLWRALHGPEREVIFRQQAVVAQQGFSDFTHPDNPVTIQSKTFPHLLYQFRLAYSGWRSVTVVQVVRVMRLWRRACSEPYNSGWQSIEHRTDSLSAARNTVKRVD